MSCLLNCFFVWLPGMVYTANLSFFYWPRLPFKCHDKLNKNIFKVPVGKICMRDPIDKFKDFRYPNREKTRI